MNQGEGHFQQRKQYEQKQGLPENEIKVCWVKGRKQVWNRKCLIGEGVPIFQHWLWGKMSRFNSDLAASFIIWF